jgi:hypothetical protein
MAQERDDLMQSTLNGTRRAGGDKDGLVHCQQRAEGERTKVAGREETMSQSGGNSLLCWRGGLKPRGRRQGGPAA